MVSGEGEKTHGQKKEWSRKTHYCWRYRVCTIICLSVSPHVPPHPIWTNSTGWQTLHVARHHKSPLWTSPGEVDYSGPEPKQILEATGCCVAVYLSIHIKTDRELQHTLPL